jgi:hypothetical protein
MNRFTASRLSDGNKLFPDEILIDETSVTIKSPRLFGGRATTFPLGQITVSVNLPFLGFCDLNFYANGTSVSVHGFTDLDANNIKWLISNGGDYKRKKKVYDDDLEDEVKEEMDEDTDDENQELVDELEEEIESLKEKIEKQEDHIFRLRKLRKEDEEELNELLEKKSLLNLKIQYYEMIFTLLYEVSQPVAEFPQKMLESVRIDDELFDLSLLALKNIGLTREVLNNLHSNSLDDLNRIIEQLEATKKSIND